MRSPYCEVTFAEDGAIESLVDLECDREVLSAPGNVFEVWEDRPGRFEAWEISKDYRLRPAGRVEFVGIEDGEPGPLAASKVLRWRIGDSTLDQEIILYANSRRMDFKTRVDWREAHKLLRVSFPVAVLDRFATYEIAFGVITRPTRPTSPYDRAKFEVPFIRWFDVGEDGYGVSFLNNGKYGGCVREGVASISLLRAPRFPDPESDLGEHEFTYSLFPHKGDWRSAGTLSEALLLNNPLVLFEGVASAASGPYFEISTEGVCVEAFKRAEDGDGYVLRLVEYFGRRGAVDVKMPFALESIEPCTVIEKPSDEKAALEGDGFSFDRRPFGIHSFRLRFGR
jgi:alpha-mannosidase